MNAMKPMFLFLVFFLSYLGVTAVLISMSDLSS